MQTYKKGLFLLLLLLAGFSAQSQENLSPYDTLIVHSTTALQQGELELAKDMAYAALELMPHGQAPNYLLGVCYATDCYRSQEHCNLGITFLNASIALDRNYESPYFHRSLCQLGKEDYTAALADIDAQIALDSTDPRYFLLRAEVYYSLGNKKGVCDNLTWWKSYGGEVKKGKDLVGMLEEFCGADSSE